MKKTLLLFFLSLFNFQAHSQFMQILSTQTTTVANGININLQTGTGHGAGLLSNSYTITGNVIDLDVCYWFDNTLPILYFTHNFFIPLSTPGDYTINIHILMSQSTEVCDNFANPANISVPYSFLSRSQNELAEIKIYPNPTSGTVFFTGLEVAANQLEVFDISGKVVFAPSQFDGSKVDLTHLQDGIYFIKIHTESVIVNRKIMLRK
jgi:hypothetical protein